MFSLALAGLAGYMDLYDMARLTASVGAGVSGGALFAFSSFVMPALRRSPDGVGLRAMQAINAAAPRPSFMIPLFGTGALGAGVAAVGLARGDGPAVLPAALLYAAALAITVGYHVPRNDALARLDPASPTSREPWRRYLAEWTRANHVRTAAAIAAAALFALPSR